MQVTLQQPAIKYLLDSSVDFLDDLLGYSPRQTKLEIVNENNWQDFSLQRGLNPESRGVYLPRNQTAFISGENPLSLFHEYFGHGLYFEQTLVGKKFIELEQILLKQEHSEFGGRNFNLGELATFRQENSVFQQLEQIRKDYLSECELFAIWTEHLLANNFGLNNDFEEKYSCLKNSDLDSVVDFSKQHGNLATFYEFNLARNTSPIRVKKLLEDIYGTSVIMDSKLILLSGSKKPFSDIDLFSCSETLENTKNDWLDLVVFDEVDFEKRVALFETQITHPIIAGEFVAGERKYFEEKKFQLKEQPITEQAIRHNLLKSEESRIAFEKEKDESLKKVYGSYFQTYLANAMALREGKRLFTKEDLLNYLKKLKVLQQPRQLTSPDLINPISQKLKGGINK